MYSLEQVIYFLEQRQQTEDWNIRDNAIAYLKGYQEVLQEYAQMKLDAVKNDPLSWKELTEMENKPVWLRYGTFDDSGWSLISEVREDEAWIEFVLPWGLRLVMHKDMIGKTWNAYRKEHCERTD